MSYKPERPRVSYDANEVKSYAKAYAQMEEARSTLDKIGSSCKFVKACRDHKLEIVPDGVFLRIIVDGEESGFLDGLDCRALSDFLKAFLDAGALRG